MFNIDPANGPFEYDDQTMRKDIQYYSSIFATRVYIPDQTDTAYCHVEIAYSGVIDNFSLNGQKMYEGANPDLQNT